MTYQDSGVEFPFDICSPLILERPKGSGTFVRLSEDVRKTVVYLGHELPGAESEINPCGTGFLIANGFPGGSYLVTAAHVAMDLEDGPFEIRLNQKKNPDTDELPSGRLHRIEKATWFYHPTDKTVDVAVMPFEAPEWADVVWWKARHFATAFKVKTKNLGAGDFTYVVGILPHMKGKKRNMPAVHTGHIVLMGDGEKVTVSDWRSTSSIKKTMEIDAYLIQAMALHGSSGSPVFARRSLEHPLELPRIDQNPVNTAIPGSLWFLGIWRGAWFGTAPEDMKIPERARVPYGFGTVVPAPKINEILERSDLAKMRRDAMKAVALEYEDEPLKHEVTRVDAKERNKRLGRMLTTGSQPSAQQRKKKTAKKSRVRSQ